MNNTDLYVRNLKKKYPDIPNPCLKCKLFLESKKYKQGYEWTHCLEDHESIEGRKKVLFILPHPKERINVEDYITSYFKNYIVYTTYAIKCSPGDTVPKLHHTRMCSNFLRQEIEEIQPDLVIWVGKESREAYKELYAKEKNTD